MKSKITDEDKNSQFLRDIYGDNIPDELEKEVYPDGTIVYSHGKPNIRKMIEFVINRYGI